MSPGASSFADPRRAEFGPRQFSARPVRCCRLRICGRVDTPKPPVQCLDRACFTMWLLCVHPCSVPAISIRVPLPRQHRWVDAQDCDSGGGGHVRL